MTAKPLEMPRSLGMWEMQGRELVLTSRPWCRIDLDDCGSSAQLLDWVFHYVGKGLSDQELADMLRALRVLLDPCGTLCSGGVDRKRPCD